MWRWKTLVLVVLLYKHSSTQPISEDSPNERPTRQLDFNECCPCSDKSDAFNLADDPVEAASDDVFSRSRDDDCPCRARDGDSLGASSVFFPTAMRAAGNLLRPADKKEDLKPLFNPEVGLASSVLQTLHEVTDREYQDALARDAAKSAAKAAEDFILGEPSPQESADVFTILLKPTDTLTDDDDAVPQASRIQQSRCIHPFPIARSSTGKMKMASKSSSIYHKPRLSKMKPKILHRNFYDMDSGTGASNVHEQIVPIDEDTQEQITDTSPLRILDSSKIKNTATTGINDNYDYEKLSEMQLNSAQNKLKDFESGRAQLLQSIREKTTRSLARFPKFKVSNMMSDTPLNNNEDLNPVSSTNNEHEESNTPFFSKSSPSDLIKPKTPLNLANLLNLRDVELVPLKELIKKPIGNTKVSRPKFTLPSVLSRDVDNDDVLSSDKSSENTVEAKNTQVAFNSNNIKSNRDDSEGSSSIVNSQRSSMDTHISDGNHNDVFSNEKFHFNENQEDSANKASTEKFDTITDSKDDILTSAITKETSIMDERNSEDSETDTSNNINNIIKPLDQEQENITKSTEDQQIKSDEFSNTENQTEVSSQDKRPKLKLLDPIAVNKTLSVIKENIIKKLEQKKLMKNNIKNKNLLNHDSVNTGEENNIEEKAGNENQSQDSQNEASMFVTTVVPNADTDDSGEPISTVKPDSVEKFEDPITTFQPEILSDNEKGASECSVSMQDLQKLSDSMLKHEERELGLKSAEDNKPFDEVTDQALLDKDVDENMLDLDKSANRIAKTETEPENLDDFQVNSKEEEVCSSDIDSFKSKLSEADTNGEASELIINKIPRENYTLGSNSVLQPRLKEPLPEISKVFKLPVVQPLSTLEDFNNKLLGLIDNEDKSKVDLVSAQALDSNEKLEASNPVMAADASTSSFQTSLPPTRRIDDIHYDTLKLKPQSSKLPNVPKIGIQSYKTKLPIAQDLSLKPIKLQSTAEDKLGLLGAPLSIGKKNNRQHLQKTNLLKNKKESGILNDPLNIKRRLDNGSEKVLDLPFEATKNIHSIFKNTHKALEPKGKQAAKSNLNILRSPKSSSSLSETISRNHEDLNDKLRGLHTDLQDRIETMRNELIDRSKLLTSGSNAAKPTLRSSSNVNKLTKNKPMKHSWQASSTREPMKPTTTRKHAQKPSKISLPPRPIEQKKLRMPTSASVQVPKTVQVPELKPTSTKIKPLTLQRASNIQPERYTDISNTYGKPIGKQSDNLQNSLLKKPVAVSNFGLPNKESKIIVTFSTTPRPAMVIKNKARNSLPQQTGKSLTKQNHGINYEDHDGSPSDYRNSKISIPTVGHVNRQYSNTNQDGELSPRRSAISKGDGLEILGKEKETGKGALTSWPRADESSFLSKVKEAVQTRLSKVKPPETLKQTNFQGNEENQLREPEFEMARSASENTDIMVEPPMKENVSYKCTIVCNAE